MFRRAHGGIAAAVVVAALSFASPGHAVRGWHPPVQIGMGGIQPKIAVNADGTAAVAWIGSESVQAAIRTSGTWSAPQDLGGGAYVPPEVAVDGSGNVVVVWEGRDYVVHAAVKPAGGSWLPSQAISAPGTGWPLGAHVAFAGDGSATAIWYRPVGYGDLRIETSVRPASSGEWQPSVEIGRGANPDIAVQPDGSAVAVWSAWPGDYAIQAAVRGSDGIWAPPATLSGPAYIFSVFPRVAVDGAGNATALWSRMRQDQVMALESASRPFGSAGWEPPDTIATGRVYGYIQGISHAGLAVDPAGNLVTAWEQWDGSPWVRAAYRVPGGSWQAPQELSQRSENLDPVVAVDLAGDALVLWSRAASSRLDALIQVSFRDVATSIWTAPMSISGSGGSFPDVAFDGSGNAVAVWARYVESGPFPIEAAAFAEGGVPPPPGPPPGPGPPPPDPSPCEPACPPPPPARKCRVPRVVGKKLATARTAIRRARCSVGRIRRARSRRAKGRVVGQSPRAGRRVRDGTRVNLVVSRGR